MSGEPKDPALTPPEDPTEFYTPPPDGPIDPNIGLVLHGKYRIEKRIGDRGGMGNVYLGTNVRANVPVAIKILKPEYQNEDSLARRFQQEGSLALEHDNIVKIYEVQNTDVPAYIVMELLDGITLANLIQKRGPLPETMVKDIFAQVLKALAFLHAPERGILHRDIKPSNIMLIEREPDRYDVRLIDFGIAKRAGGSSGDDGITRWDPTPICTPQYAPHEQFLSMSGVTAQSDLYSVGVCIYEALTGRLPYDVERKVEQGKIPPSSRREAYFAAHQSGKFPRPSRLRPGISRDWNRVLAKAMHPDKEKRHADAGEFLADLLSIRAGGSLRRHLAVGVGSLAVAAAVLLWPWFPGTPEVPEGLVRLPAARVTLPDGSGAFVGELFTQPHEVTNRQYLGFVQATRAQLPRNWDQEIGRPPDDLLDAPVAFVSLPDAKKYADWAGLRLPTTAEWQRVAVAEAEGAPVEGTGGGVAEWTGTSIDSEGERWVVRGGADGRAEGASVSEAVPFTERAAWIGFRCVASGRSPRLIERLLGEF